MTLSRTSVSRLRRGSTIIMNGMIEDAVCHLERVIGAPKTDRCRFCVC